MTEKTEIQIDVMNIPELQKEIQILHNEVSKVAQKYEQLMKPFKSDTITVYKNERLKLKIYVNPEKKIAEVLEVKKDED